MPEHAQTWQNKAKILQNPTEININSSRRGVSGSLCQSVLINVARGGVCDQVALADLLSQRRFRAGRGRG